MDNSAKDDVAHKREVDKAHHHHHKAKGVPEKETGRAVSGTGAPVKERDHVRGGGKLPRDIMRDEIERGMDEAKYGE